MHWIKYIRVTLGLSQRAFADYLLITRAMVGHLENDRRKPNKVVLERLNALHAQVVKQNQENQENQSEPAVIKLPLHPTVEKMVCKLNQKITRNQYKIQRLTTNLEELNSQYAYNQQGYRTVTSIEETQFEAKEAEKNRLWTNLYKQETSNNLQLKGIMRIGMLRQTLAGLKAQTEEAKFFLQELSAIVQLPV